MVATSHQSQFGMLLSIIVLAKREKAAFPAFAAVLFQQIFLGDATQIFSEVLWHLDTSSPSRQLNQRDPASIKPGKWIERDAEPKTCAFVGGVDVDLLEFIHRAAPFERLLCYEPVLCESRFPVASVEPSKNCFITWPIPCLEQWF